jgi:hypothetical protein
MLIMLRWSSVARRCVQVTSNVRHPRTKVQMQDVRFGKVSLEKSSAKVARAGGNSRLVNRSSASGSGNANLKIQRSAQASPEQSPARLGPSMVRQEGQEKCRRTFWLLPFRRKASCRSMQNVVSTRSPFARMPNHSVNLTRNSAPRWPSEARYAHNAPLVHRVTLSHAGYLKR